jgi:hypothetical protein
MRTFAAFVFIFVSLQLSAQRECATKTYADVIRRSNPAAAKRLDAADAFVKQQSRNYITGITGTGSIEPVLIRIPVVVHVLYNTASQNISDAQIQSGLDALNRDFRRKNKDTAYTPQRFKAVAADVEIEFYLATADPNGVATTGILRKQTSVPAFNMDDKIKYTAQGGDNAWDSKSYLNIWIGNTRRLLGYATMPGGDASVDGLVINYTAFGTIKKSGPYNFGRTAVHEVGHWLGLQHIWGDTACGDDEVGDTPVQGGYTAGCPTGFRSTCGNAPDGDMYMNYMDFTNDACMNLFTQGQKKRMRAQFAYGGPRYSLLTSTGLNTPWVEATPIPLEDTTARQPLFKVFPNPAKNEVVLQCANTEVYSGTLYLVNISGMPVQKIIVTSNTQKVNLTALKPGFYFLQGNLNSTKIYQKIVKID